MLTLKQIKIFLSIEKLKFAFKLSKYVAKIVPRTGHKHLSKDNWLPQKQQPPKEYRKPTLQSMFQFRFIIHK